MKRIITFLHRERVWEQSQFGLLLRINAYYTLYPYIFSFHDPQSFKAAEHYAAYEAHSYFLNFSPDDFPNADELELWQKLLRKNSTTVVEFQERQAREYNAGRPAFRKAVQHGRSPDKPGFVCRLSKEKVKRLRKKFGGLDKSDGDKAVVVFESCDHESAANQREITAEFCRISHTLHFLQQNPSLLPSGTKLPSNIPKSKVFPLVGKLSPNSIATDDEVNTYVNWHAPIAPLIYAMSSCVEFGHHMRDDFVDNLNVIVARHHEFYNIITNEDREEGKVYKYAKEKHLKLENVYALDLPPPPSVTPLPKPWVQERFLKMISDLLQ